MNGIWQYIKNNKMITIFNVVIVLVLILPYSITYSGGPTETDDLIWQLNYVYKDFELFIFFIPLSILAISFQLCQPNIWRRIMLIILAILCCGYSFITFMILSIPTQDYMPSWGLLLTATLGPLTLLILGIETNFFKNKTRFVEE